MVGLLVSLLLLPLSGPPTDWQQFEETYLSSLSRNEPDGWKDFLPFLEDDSPLGQVAHWVLFRRVRDGENRLLAYHYASDLLQRPVPPVIVEDALDFILVTHHEIGESSEALRLYEANRHRTTARFQRAHRVRIAYDYYLSGDRKYRRAFQSILRGGSHRDRLDLYLLIKRKKNLLAAEDLVRVLESATSLQRWDVADMVRDDLTRSRLSSKQKALADYFRAREHFRLQEYGDAFVLFRRVAAGSRDSLRHKALYQAGRCALYQRKPEAARQIFSSVRGELTTISALTLGRMALYERDWEEAADQRDRIRERGARQKLTLLLGIALLRDGRITQARKVLKSLPVSPERDYWLWKSQPLGSAPPSPGMTYYTYAVRDGTEPEKPRGADFCRHEDPGDPHTFPEYLLWQGLPELAYPFIDQIHDSDRGDDRCSRSRLYARSGHTGRAITNLWREEIRHEGFPPWDWPPDLLDLLYPRAFSGIITATAERYHLPGGLLYSIIRQESRFDEDVYSSAGAVGLMQLMPATAAALSPGRNNLDRPGENVDLGGRYLASLYEKYGRWEKAVAAYNAGEDAVDLWNEQLGPCSMDTFVAFIPFSETRTYVDRVFAGWVAYDLLLQSDSAGSPAGDLSGGGAGVVAPAPSVRISPTASRSR